MSKLNVQTLSGVEGLSQLREEWQELFTAASATPFLSWEWISTWYKWFGQDKTPLLLTVRDNDRLIGLLPLGEEHQVTTRFGPRAHRLSVLGEPQGAPDYLDVISLPGRERECATAIFDHLSRSGLFDLLELDSFAADSPSLTSLMHLFGNRADFEYRLTPLYVCPRINLEHVNRGQEASEILAGFRRAKYFRYCQRRLLSRGGFEHRMVKDPHDVGAAFERFMHLHETRWSGDGGSAALGDEMQRAFHRDLVVQLATAGLIRFDELWVNDLCWASLYTLSNGKTTYLYLTSYDPVWKEHSPGFVVIGLSIAEAVRQGHRFYDFLRGDEPYKYDWTNDARMTVAAQISNRSSAARLTLAQEHLKQTARALLPDRIKKEWRRIVAGSAKAEDAEAAPATPSQTISDAGPTAVISQ